jgi:hypothetical protein
VLIDQDTLILGSMGTSMTDNNTYLQKLNLKNPALTTEFSIKGDMADMQLINVKSYSEEEGQEEINQFLVVAMINGVVNVFDVDSTKPKLIFQCDFKRTVTKLSLHDETLLVIQKQEGSFLLVNIGNDGHLEQKEVVEAPNGKLIR